eukprot:gnl/TRDRNA2_/TRDRNA2_193333_c0_seq1.p1 gnl/TRDRNA2_/TRDRNA2_193333_c0~~gnl/TRDRNA2_/TRDRNA2_193333_c0_seq1.p1  ORF type:complete len:413 (-),score=43.87 gnl/TRDRNA2_/TRDRNA2_193333_c0_seq1:1-1239(-)
MHVLSGHTPSFHVPSTSRCLLCVCLVYQAVAECFPSDGVAIGIDEADEVGLLQLKAARQESGADDPVLSVTPAFQAVLDRDWHDSQDPRKSADAAFQSVLDHDFQEDAASGLHNWHSELVLGGDNQDPVFRTHVNIPQIPKDDKLKSAMTALHLMAENMTATATADIATAPSGSQRDAAELSTTAEVPTTAGTATATPTAEEPTSGGATGTHGPVLDTNFPGLGPVNTNGPVLNTIGTNAVHDTNRQVLDTGGPILDTSGPATSVTAASPTQTTGTTASSATVNFNIQGVPPLFATVKRIFSLLPRIRRPASVAFAKPEDCTTSPLICKFYDRWISTLDTIGMKDTWKIFVQKYYPSAMPVRVEAYTTSHVATFVAWFAFCFMFIASAFLCVVEPFNDLVEISMNRINEGLL